MQEAEAPPRTGREVAFDITDAAFSSDDFRMFSFKVRRCPRARPHDWTLCPFAHPGEKAKRRDPRKMQYSGTACPDFRKGGICPRGESCPFAHGVFECWLHPSRYRTQMCTDGVNCKRRVCFFAHFESELRKAEADPILLQFQLHKDLGSLGAAADMRAYQQQQQQQQQIAHALGGLLAQQQLTPPQSPQYVNGMPFGGFGGGMPLAAGAMAPLVLPGGGGGMGGALDGSAPCTPTAAVSLTPATSQDSATLLAHLQMIQQQAQDAAAAAGRPRSAGPLSPGSAGGDSVQSGGAGAGSLMGLPGLPRPVSASTSGGTLGSSGSPPLSPTGVAARREGPVAGSGVPSTPSVPELSGSLKGPLSPLGAALLQQQAAQAQEGAALAAALLSGSGVGGAGAGGLSPEALALLQAAGMGAGGLHHLDQTSLLVALHSLALSGGGAVGGGGGLPPAAAALAAGGAGGSGGGLIRHASDVYMQSRAVAAAAAAAALSPPGHGLVSHRRSMDNSMLAQLHSLTASSPMPLEAALGAAEADLTLEAAGLSPIAIPPPQTAADLALDTARLSAAMSASQLSTSLPPPSPTYLASLAAAVTGASPGLPPASPLARAAAAAEQQQRARALSPQLAAGSGLHRIVTSSPQGEGSAAAAAAVGLSLPSTPQTAPAALAARESSWTRQLCSIDEGEPVVPSPPSFSSGLGAAAGAGTAAGAGADQPAATVYKTLSDPSVLIRNLSFDNILAELPRSSSQVALASQQQQQPQPQQAAASGGESSDGGDSAQG